MITYAPFPAQAAFGFTPQQMARLDQRYATPELWPADPSQLVQDSALLLSAHVGVQIGPRRWEGRPDLTSPAPLMPEADWEQLLGLRAPAQTVQPTTLSRRLQDGAGVVYTFGPQYIRAFRLGDDIDLLELDFLQEDGFPGIHLLRGAALGPDGRLRLWRCELGHVASTPSRPR